MVRVRNVFLNYEEGGETSFLFMGRGRNVFPKYELGAKRLTKKWCELTMGRKVCVPYTCTVFGTHNTCSRCPPSTTCSASTNNNDNLNSVIIQSTLLPALKLKFHLISHVHSHGRHSIGHCITSGLLIMQHNDYLEFVFVVFYHLMCNQCGSLYIKTQSTKYKISKFH